MPYEVGNGAILEVSIRGHYQEQRFISLFHYIYERPSGTTDGRVLINTVDPLLNANAVGKLVRDYADCLHGNAALEEVVYQWVFPTRRARVVKTPAKLDGSAGGDPAPPNLAMALTKQSDTAGRAGVGTLHMPALSITNLDGGRFTVLGQDLYGTLLTRLAEPVNIEFGENLVPVIYHRASPAFSAPITSAISNNTVRTMHRRTVGLGE